MKSPGMGVDVFVTGFLCKYTGWHIFKVCLKARLVAILSSKELGRLLRMFVGLLNVNFYFQNCFTYPNRPIKGTWC